MKQERVYEEKSGTTTDGRTITVAAAVSTFTKRVSKYPNTSLPKDSHPAIITPAAMTLIDPVVLSSGTAPVAINSYRRTVTEVRRRSAKNMGTFIICKARKPQPTLNTLVTAIGTALRRYKKS